MQRPELLAPAGDMERLEYALHYGADAVYLAYTDFGMRAACPNFTKEQLYAALQKCRAAGARMYVAVNIFPTEAERERLPAFLAEMETLRPDGLIVADLGVMALAQRYAPDVDLHISVQANITNAAAASRYYELGAKRVVLARELSLDDIAHIRRDTPSELELECFVHGAVCMSVSGRCHLSAYLTGRDANRGACTQPCRWQYAVMEQTRAGQFFPVESHENGSYIFNAKDLCMAAYTDRLIAAGVDCFKIEGRVKTAYYVAAVVKAYREAIDEVMAFGTLRDPAYYTEQLEKVSHRAYGTGFFFDRSGGGSNTETGGYIRTYEVAAVVEDGQDGVLTVRQRNKFSVGDTLEILSPSEKCKCFTVSEIRDETGRLQPDAPHAEQRLYIPCPYPCRPMDILRKKSYETAKKGA